MKYHNPWISGTKFGLMGFFALWLGASTVQLTQMLLNQEPDQAPKTETRPLVEPAQNIRPEIDVRSLLASPLFPEVDVVVTKETQPEPVEEEPLVETQLNLRLKGLFTAMQSGGKQTGGGQAIIANGSKEKLYHVDDEIEGLTGVKLTAVYADRVRLDNRGNAELLYLYTPDDYLQASSVSNENLAAVSAPEVPQKVEKRLSDLIRVIRERDKATGSMLGFRVLPGRDRESFNLSGLQANDVITTIDGNQLTDLKTARDIYRTKRNATQVSLIILRNGSELSLDIDLTELNGNNI